MATNANKTKKNKLKTNLNGKAMSYKGISV